MDPNLAFPIVEQRAVARISARLWSRSVSIKPVARQLGARAAIVHDAGDPAPATGLRVAPAAATNYLVTAEVRTRDLSTVGPEVAELHGLLAGDPLILSLIKKYQLDAVVRVVLTGDRGAARIEDLRIDRRPFGSVIGLVVENHTRPDGSGAPRRLLIGAAAFDLCSGD